MLILHPCIIFAYLIIARGATCLKKALVMDHDVKVIKSKFGIKYQVTLNIVGFFGFTYFYTF